MTDVYHKTLVDGPNPPTSTCSVRRPLVRIPAANTGVVLGRGQGTGEGLCLLRWQNNGTFNCRRRQETQFGVGCSSGPGGTSKGHPLATWMLERHHHHLRDQPNAFSGAVCQKIVEIFAR